MSLKRDRSFLNSLFTFYSALMLAILYNPHRSGALVHESPTFDKLKA
jgi:hypothetical protein